MDELNIISAKVGIQTTYLKVKNSLEEIKTNHPNRKDIIESMERTLKDIQEISLVYSTMEKEYRSAVQSCFRLEKLLLEEKFKVKDLKNQLEFKDISL
jgi:predicted RNase H-like nuclease (RuvC/YqgF family)